MPKPLLHEDRVQLAVEALKSKQIRSLRKAEAPFDVPKSTLYDRGKGGSTRQDAQVKHRKLLPTEETALIQWIESMEGILPEIEEETDVIDDST